jgi:colanic acid/amylovoran biosynthesis glycosyltransferase
MTSLWGARRIAYLIGHYPAVTHTFIQREIHELRRQGFEIDTFSIWRARQDQLLARVDRAEHARTYPLLPPRPGDYLRWHIRSALGSPRRYVEALTRALRLSTHGLRGRLLGLSWFLEAVVVQRICERRGIRHVHVHLDGTAPAVGLLVTHLGNGGAEQGPWSFSMTVHGSKEFFDVARQRLARKVRAARFVVCVSDFTRSQLMALVDDTHWPKLHVVHCGIDPEHFAPPEEGLARDGLIRILTIGRLDNMKGVAILVEALAELRRRGAPVALTVVGDGPQREHLQRLAVRDSVGEHITWAGTVGQDGIRALYHAAHVFCLPSFAEGIPVVLMEAMSTGLPVVANNITGIPELVEHEVSGLLLRPGRSDLLVRALERLVRDPDLRARMGGAGREKVRREFESRSVGLQLAELFTKELSRSDAHPSATSVAARR